MKGEALQDYHLGLSASFGKATKSREKVKNTVLLTEGAIDDLHGTIELVEEHCHERNRCFLLGLGGGTSSHFVKALSVAGQADYQIVTGAHDLENAVTLIEQALLPYLCQLEIDWEFKDDLVLRGY